MYVAMRSMIYLQLRNEDGFRTSFATSKEIDVRNVPVIINLLCSTVRLENTLGLQGTHEVDDKRNNREKEYKGTEQPPTSSQREDS